MDPWKALRMELMSDSWKVLRMEPVSAHAFHGDNHWKFYTARHNNLQHLDLNPCLILLYIELVLNWRFVVSQSQDTFQSLGHFLDRQN